MVWRLLGGFFGIAFVVAGFNVASNAQDSCARVTLSAAERRTIGYTCWTEVEWANRDQYEVVDSSGATSPPPGTAIPGTAIALVAFAIGMSLLTLGLWPILRAVLLREGGPEPDDETPQEMPWDRAARERAAAREAKASDAGQPAEMPWDRAARERAAAREAKRAAEEGPPADLGPDGT